MALIIPLEYAIILEQLHTLVHFIVSLKYYIYSFLLEPWEDKKLETEWLRYLDTNLGIWVSAH